MIREREAIEIRLGEQQRELEDAMIREAIELGANGLIEFFVEGPFPIEEGELAGRVSILLRLSRGNETDESPHLSNSASSRRFRHTCTTRSKQTSTAVNSSS